MTVNLRHSVATIKVVRGEPHTKLRGHFWYSYEADDDRNHRYLGKVLHNYDNGAFALVQKVSKAITCQQKAAKQHEKETAAQATQTV